MKTTRVLIVLLFGMIGQSSLFAQTVDFLIVVKAHEYVQTNNATTVDAANPWLFEAHVEGTNLSGIATPILTKPSGSGSTTMTYNAGGDKWDVKNTYTSQALLNAAYGDGNYSLTALTQTISPISITGDLFPSAPLATNLSGGTISGGILTWNVAQALTITITGAADHMSIDVNGTSYNNGTEAFSVASHTFIIPASSMLAGNNYNVQLNFDNVVGGIPGLQTVATGPLAFVPAQYAGIYNAVTTFTIQAIPEPSTYAEIFGAVALAGVVIARRRRVA